MSDPFCYIYCSITQIGRYEKRSMVRHHRKSKVRGSRTGRPIMALLDLLGRRMALRILWELSRVEAPLTFRALQAAAGTNPTVLNTRLAELREAGLVTRDERGYRLSDRGSELVNLLLPLHAWAESQARRRG
jgi:DNA-binding HxlR family transcriptional regulator